MLTGNKTKQIQSYRHCKTTLFNKYISKTIVSEFLNCMHLSFKRNRSYDLDHLWVVTSVLTGWPGAARVCSLATSRSRPSSQYPPAGLPYLTYLAFREPLTLFTLTTTVIILLVAIKVDS